MTAAAETDALMSAIESEFERARGRISRFIRPLKTNSFAPVSAEELEAIANGDIKCFIPPLKTNYFAHLSAEELEAIFDGDIARFVKRPRPRTALATPLGRAVGGQHPVPGETDAERAPGAFSSALPSLPVAFLAGYGAMPLNHVTSAAFAAIHRGETRAGWDDDAGNGPPSYSAPTNKGQGQILIIMRHDEAAVNAPDASDVWERVRTLDDDTSDVFAVCMAHWWNYSRRPGQSVLLTVDDILDARGIQRMRRRDEPRNWQHGHRSEDRRKVGRALERLTNLWVRADNVAVVRKRRSVSMVECRLLDMRKRHVQYDEDGQPWYLAAEVMPGDWIVTYQDQDLLHYGWFPQQALRYDKGRQWVEKRLAKYLSYLFRSEARRGAPAKRLKVATLLGEAVLSEDEGNPKRTLVRLHSALDRLRNDCIIASWAYSAPDAYDRLPARQWFGQWRELTIDLGVPECLRDRYRTLSARSVAS